MQSRVASVSKRAWTKGMSATPGLQLCANHRLLQREAALMRVERRTNAVSEWVIRSWFGTVSISRETAVSPPLEPMACL